MLSEVAFHFSVQICNQFPISKCRGESDLRLCRLLQRECRCVPAQCRLLIFKGVCARFIERFVIVMMALITFNNSLVPLIEGLCSSNPCEIEFSGFWTESNRRLRDKFSLIWPTKSRLQVRSESVVPKLCTDPDLTLLCISILHPLPN